MSVAEILGFITGAACVLLAIRENVWTWPIGITNKLIFMVVFWDAKLYAGVGLQLVFMNISVYGWWNWLHGAGGSVLPVRRTALKLAAVLALITAIVALLLTWLLRDHTDSTTPWSDAVTTALSITAQFMMGRKLIENWLLWIFTDVLLIALYVYKHLYLTAVLYSLFICMCVAGYREWRKSFQSTPAYSAAKMEPEL